MLNCIFVYLIPFASLLQTAVERPLINTVQQCSHCSAVEPSAFHQEHDTKADTARWSSHTAISQHLACTALPGAQERDKHPWSVQCIPTINLQLQHLACGRTCHLLQKMRIRSTVSIGGGDVAAYCSQLTSPGAMHWNLGWPIEGHLLVHSYHPNCSLLC